MKADEVIATLGLKPHPEGGHFAETFRDAHLVNDRAASTAIFYLLRAGEESRWHRLDVTEVWHWYAGAPLMLDMAESERGPATSHVLGPDLSSGARPQLIVPARAWQSARSLGAYTLVGCTMAPGFEYTGFELAPVSFSPGGMRG
jgi:predicted cupin superfamily sugar epimerase